MKPIPHQFKELEDLRAQFLARRDAIQQRLAEFSSVQPDEYFYELVYCLLTPQSSAVNAGKAVDALKEAGFRSAGRNATQILANRRHYIRFHNTKARHIVEARRRLPEITAMLQHGSSGTELREWLVRNVRGLGWKEASHFLRNIGYRNLAILDRHILRNLKRHAVLRSLPETLTPRRYLSIESKFSHFADAVGISMYELDLLFWSRETGEILK